MPNKPSGNSGEQEKKPSTSIYGIVRSLDGSEKKVKKKKISRETVGKEIDSIVEKVSDLINDGKAAVIEDGSLIASAEATDELMASFEEVDTPASSSGSKSSGSYNSMQKGYAEGYDMIFAKKKKKRGDPNLN